MVLKYSLAVFQEPRGMMRILQLIFAVCAFSTTVNFEVDVHLKCKTTANPTPLTNIRHIDYPFRFEHQACQLADNTTVPLSADVSSDAQFFVATGVLSMMYCVFIIGVYAFIDDFYRDKDEIPLADLMMTAILALFWLSGAAAWSNGASALKSTTNAVLLKKMCPMCEYVFTGSFSKLNISLVLGYLNFFLWTSDLWFLYKETIYFPGRQNANVQQDVAGFTANAGGFDAGAVGDDYSGSGFNAPGQQQQQPYGGGPQQYGMPQQQYGAPQQQQYGAPGI